MEMNCLLGEINKKKINAIAQLQDVSRADE